VCEGRQHVTQLAMLTALQLLLSLQRQLLPTSAPASNVSGSNGLASTPRMFGSFTCGQRGGPAVAGLFWRTNLKGRRRQAGCPPPAFPATGCIYSIEPLLPSCCCPLTSRSVSWGGASSRSASTTMGGPWAGAGLGLLHSSGASRQAKWEEPRAQRCDAATLDAQRQPRGHQQHTGQGQQPAGDHAACSTETV